MSDAIDVSDRTKFAMPIRNLISLIAFRLDDLTKEIEDMKEMDREIIMQHEKLFSILGNQARSGGPSAYGNY